MTCEDVEGLLLEFVEGELDGASAASVRGHIQGCPGCAARERETRRMVGDLSIARSFDDPKSAAVPQDQSPLAPPPAPSAAALHTIGEFEIIEELGRGGMGVVYRARQTTLRRIVALKVMSAGLLQTQRSITRFLKEAQAAARLHHTNIVPIYAQGNEGAYFYYAMELVEGQPLSRVLAEDPLHLRLPGDQPPALANTPGVTAAPATRNPDGASASSPPSHALLTRSRWRSASVRRTRDYKRLARLMAEAAEGLQHAHDEGVIHRDIKPHNLMLGRDDKLHITDFGLARLLDEPGMTLSSEIVGTPAYISPEQITGPRETIDHRTDIFSLGVTLYEMLTLRRPFTGDTYDQVITSILKREPPAPRRVDSHIPLDLETICLRSLEKEPKRRFQSAGEMARDLRRYAEDFPIASRRIGPLGKLVRWTRRHPARAAATGATALVLLLLPIVGHMAIAQSNQRVEAAYELLLQDYHSGPAARAELSRAWWPGGDTRKRALAEALVDVLPRPEASAERLEALLRTRPSDRDAHYLAAWAYRRQGAARWPAALLHIEAGDKLSESAEVSAAGCLFRGQALLEKDPEAAIQSYNDAIQRRAGFVQAALLQGRAINQFMYRMRNSEYYRLAVTNLESTAFLQPRNARPQYLLALAHLYAAEIAAAAGRADEAHAAYDRSLAAAATAQRAAPGDPTGFSAEALALESQGDFEGALRVWGRMPKFDEKTLIDSARERHAYPMRLWYWLGDLKQAEAARAARYESIATRSASDDADAALYKALFAHAAGEQAVALATLQGATPLITPHAESLLLLDAAYLLIGETPPPGLLAGDLDCDTRLSTGWSPEWVRSVLAWRRGERNWDELVANAARLAPRASDQSLLLAGASFYRGVRELAAGKAEAASGAFEAAWRCYDNENYCFRAKLLFVPLRYGPGPMRRVPAAAGVTPH